ncbi:MAG: hypothetical protein NTW97_10055 [Candidatus Krumholzibacteria bacterium]|nr:hypothetical protein [Candidatus Krumholzibacteria bacterium]
MSGEDAQRGALMGRLESRVVGAFIAVLMPVCCFFAAWWLGVGVVPERYVPYGAFGGLLLGVVLDALFLRRWTARAYEMRLPSLMFLYVFVSVVTYAVFMGTSVFNLVCGIVAGAYMGRRLLHAGAAGEEARTVIRRTGSFAAAVIACAAGFSAYLALRDPFAGSDLEHMFHLKFAVTRPTIVALVAAGWPVLVLCQYWLATKAAYTAYGGRRHGAGTA